MVNSNQREFYPMTAPPEYDPAAAERQGANGANTGKWEMPPALQRYIDRVGAEPRNFRKYIVKEWHTGSRGQQYYKELATINISSDSGEVSCSDPAFAPTEQEADAIKAAWREVDCPKSMPTTLVSAEAL